MRAAILLMLCVLGCGGARPRPVPETPPAVPAPRSVGSSERPPEADASFDGVRLRFVAPGRDESALRVVIEASGPGLDRWSAALPAGGRFEGLVASDASGALEPRQTSADGLVEVTFDREVRSPLVLRYAVPPSERFDADRYVADARFHLVLSTVPLPADDARRRFRVEIDREPRFVPSAASTLGLGAEHEVEARSADLRDVVVVAGVLETAHFLSRAGDDQSAMLGGPAFDPRWASAEAALIRSRIDEALRRRAAGVFPIVVMAREPRPRVPPVVVHRSGYGLRMVVLRDASWDTAVRLPLAQVFARRWLGGLLRLSGDDRWLTLGVARFVALRALLSMGTATPEEAAAELTRWEADLALGETGARGAMARGALYAARLHALARARAEHPRSLAGVLDPLMLRAEQSGAELPASAFAARVAEVFGEEEGAAFEAHTAGDGAIPLPRGAFGPCFAPGTATHRRYALGFRAPDVERDPPHTVAGVVEGGPAARAGLADGDVIHEMSYAPGDPTTQVELTVARGEQRRTLRYLPTDRSARGRSWRRRRGVRDEECVF